MNWPTFYRDRVTEEYFRHVQNKYSTFIEIILSKISRRDQIIVEAGCGICNVTRALVEKQSYDCKYIAIDKSPEMIKLSVENLATGDHEVELIVGDILNEQSVPKGDIVHSHGVLEHFSDKEINKIIDIQRKKFEYLIHYVPSDKYEEPSFGDERLMPAKRWNRICKPDQIVEFNNYYDLVLIWRN